VKEHKRPCGLCFVPLPSTGYLNMPPVSKTADFTGRATGERWIGGDSEERRQGQTEVIWRYILEDELNKTTKYLSKYGVSAETGIHV